MAGFLDAIKDKRDELARSGALGTKAKIEAEARRRKRKKMKKES